MTTEGKAPRAAEEESKPLDAARAEAKRYSGRRVTVIFGLLLTLTITAALGAFFVERTPDGPVLALVALGDEQAVVLRDDPRRGRPYLTVETLAGTERSLALFGVPAGAVPRVADDLITIPVTGARGAHEVDAFTLDEFRFVYRTGQPDPEAYPPAALPHTIGAGLLEVALYGQPVSQAVVYRRADGAPLFRVQLQPGGEVPPQVWPTPRGLLFADGTGVARSYDRRNDMSLRPPRDPRPVGGPAASFCETPDGWLFLTRAGSLHRLAVPDTATQRVARGLPSSSSLLACGSREGSLVLFLGDALHGGVVHVMRLGEDGDVTAVVTLPLGDVPAPRLQVVGDLARDVTVVDGQGHSHIVDLDEGVLLDTPSCAGGSRLLLTPEGTYAAASGVLTRTDGDTGRLRAVTIPGVSGGRALDPSQLSEHRLFVPAGSGFVVLDRSDLSVKGVKALDGVAPRDGC